MSEEKGYTIKQIADKLHVSKSAIQQKLTDDFKNKFVSKKIIGGRSTQVVNEDGFLELKKKTRVKKTVQNDNDDVIEILKQQLEQKDKQIEELQILLNQSQQLQLQQDEKIKLLKTSAKKHWWQKLF